MEDSSKDLLQLELKNSSTSSLESTLLFFNQAKKPNSDGKPMMSPMPKSQVLGKVRDFLGVMSEANKRLQQEAKNNASKFDIEALSGNESNVIEMDLMLGVADLHTPEAVAAAESAIASYQPDITLPGSSSRTESEDSSDYDSDEEDEQYDKENTCPPSELKRSESGEDESMDEADGKQKSKKRPKIVELP